MFGIKIKRERIYGHSVMVLAEAQAEDPTTMTQAADHLARAASRQIETLHAIGIVIDPDSYTEFSGEELEGFVIGYKIKGRQTRNLFQRLLWAARL